MFGSTSQQVVWSACDFSKAANASVDHWVRASLHSSSAWLSSYPSVFRIGPADVCSFSLSEPAILLIFWCVLFIHGEDWVASPWHASLKQRDATFQQIFTAPLLHSCDETAQIASLLGKQSSLIRRELVSFEGSTRVQTLSSSQAYQSPIPRHCFHQSVLPSTPSETVVQSSQRYLTVLGNLSQFGTFTTHFKTSRGHPCPFGRCCQSRHSRCGVTSETSKTYFCFSNGSVFKSVAWMSFHFCDRVFLRFKFGSNWTRCCAPGLLGARQSIRLLVALITLFFLWEVRFRNVVCNETKYSASAV